MRLPTWLVVVGGLIVAAFAASVLSRDLGTLFAFGLAAAVYFIRRGIQARMPPYVPRWLTSTLAVVLIALFGLTGFDFLLASVGIVPQSVQSNSQCHHQRFGITHCDGAAVARYGSVLYVFGCGAHCRQVEWAADLSAVPSPF